jgi:hypothetical protein
MGLSDFHIWIIEELCEGPDGAEWYVHFACPTEFGAKGGLKHLKEGFPSRLFRARGLTKFQYHAMLCGDEPDEIEN